MMSTIEIPNSLNEALEADLDTIELKRLEEDGQQHRDELL